jgi:diacylglycerol kinase family enzyme
VPSRTLDRIDVIATSISGSVSDWQKLASIEDEFRKHYTGEVEVHIVDSHPAAREEAARAVRRGGRIIVSAGGAGTCNSVLEGCCVTGRIPDGLRLAFLRKGSADLLGKALGVPDELSAAVRAILTGMAEGNFIDADVIEVSGDIPRKRRVLGFAGVGVFGDTPMFTENRFVKYYKGFLGTLFGDLGPFLVGVNLALVKYHLDALRARGARYKLLAEGLELPMSRYVSIIIMNGDLGEDFPLARGMRFGDGDFKVVAMRDMGTAASYRQLISCWKGNLFERSRDLGVVTFRKGSLEIVPERSGPYMVNVDGLILWANGPVRFGVSDRVKLVSTGKNCRLSAPPVIPQGRET